MDDDNSEKIKHGGEDTDTSSLSASISRRAALAGLAGLTGLTSMGTTSAEQNHNHLGDRWAGETGDSAGLAVVKNDSGFALRGEAGTNTDKTIDVGLAGYTSSSKGLAVSADATSKSGPTRGMLGQVRSPDGRGLITKNVSTESGSGYAHESVSKMPDGVNMRVHSEGSGSTVAIKSSVDSSEGYAFQTPDDIKIDGDVEIGGDVKVSGVKNFVQSASNNGSSQKITYTSVEAGKPHTEYSDIAEMKGGTAIVNLPKHFGMVTSDEGRIIVQVTPYSDEPVRPQVTNRSVDCITVEDFGDDTGDYTFAYTVKGIRKGFEDKEPISNAD